ncbi:MAG: DUF3465 domain-containing protein, partial [Actinomycetia bacterium]|nr:DUF3465 domain-containing protein [Actinomycetes bacterium]
MGQSVLITALLLGTLLTGGLSACGNGVPDAGNLLPDSGGAVAESQLTSDAEFAQLFERQQSGVAVLGQGTVIRILEDDNAGDRHQRFIVQLTSGQTLLIAHNIDIAP